MITYIYTLSCVRGGVYPSQIVVVVYKSYDIYCIE